MGMGLNRMARHAVANPEGYSAEMLEMLALHRTTDEFKVWKASEAKKARANYEKRYAENKQKILEVNRRWAHSPAGKAYRKAYKADIRRKQGAKSRDQITLETAAKRAAIANEKKRLSEARMDSFQGPPRPDKKTAEGYRWLYANDERFREKEKARSKAKKASVPLYYARQMLGIKDAPEALVQAKQIYLRIKKLTRSNEYEKH